MRTVGALARARTHICHARTCILPTLFDPLQPLACNTHQFARALCISAREHGSIPKMRRDFSTAALLSVCMEALTPLPRCMCVPLYFCWGGYARTLRMLFLVAVVDTPRMLMIIYRLAVPDGDFHPEKYKPPLRAKLDPSAMLVSLEKVMRD